jgi:hypothetical protein
MQVWRHMHRGRGSACRRVQEHLVDLEQPYEEVDDIVVEPVMLNIVVELIRKFYVDPT